MGIGILAGVVVYWIILIPITIVVFQNVVIREYPEDVGPLQSLIFVFVGFLGITIIDVGLIVLFLFDYEDSDKSLYSVILLHLTPLVIGWIVLGITKSKRHAESLYRWRLNRVGLGIFTGTFASGLLLIGVIALSPFISMFV